MAGLSHLPAEVLTQIAGFASKSDQVSLLLTCKHLKSVLEAIVYRDICWTYVWGSPSASAPLGSLLRSILRRPELAGYVRHFALQELDTYYGVNPYLESVLSDEDLGLAFDIIRNCDLPCSAAWRLDLAKGHADAIAAAVLSQLHHLQSLRVDFLLAADNDAVRDRPVPLDRYMEPVLRHGIRSNNTGTMSSFRQLQSVQWPSQAYKRYSEFLWDRKYCRQLDFLRAPNIRQAVLKLDGGTHHCDLALGLQTRPSNWPVVSQLTDLRLVRCTALQNVIAEVIKCAPNLQVFHLWYRRSEDELTVFPTKPFNGLKMKQALTPCKGTLRNLQVKCEIDTSTLMGQLRYEDSYAEPMGSLQSFKALTHLDLDVRFLVGEEVIEPDCLLHLVPSSLQELVLRQDVRVELGLWLEEQAERLLYFRLLLPFFLHFQEVCPNLKRVEETMSNGLPPSDAERILEICGSYGVEYMRLVDEL